MFLQRFKKENYDLLCKALEERGHTEPLDASYTVSMQLDESKYVVKIQPERANQMVVLQAVRIDRSENPPRFELITRGGVLAAFLELFRYQTAGWEKARSAGSGEIA